jgi:hypothetical protein
MMDERAPAMSRKTKVWLRAVCALCFLAAPSLVALPSPPTTATARADGDASSPYFCACCASPGEWSLTQERVDDAMLTELGRVSLGARADLFMTEAGTDAVRGIADPSESYALTHTQSRRRWTLRLRGDGGKTGTLSFDVPRTATRYAVDMREAGSAGGAGPVLYKEWRLEGPLAGTGVFRQGAGAGTRFRLILQGRGNNCPSAADFKSWTLQVYGARAEYSFYGTVAQTP